ncbi:MAG TPA: hydroxymethylbilane synthase [Armatimonadota bacterium]|jgi:hydroxymethylbilane synthase
MTTLRLGTRGSALALAQAQWVADRLHAGGWDVSLDIIRTTGDRISERAFSPGDGKGVFVAEIERALLAGQIDLAVHSMKDLPGEMPPELCLAAVPAREDPRDVLVSRDGATLADLPPGAVIGTSSLRRRAQLLAARPELTISDMRGNIDTRLRKLEDGHYDAICLAAAGLHRLQLASRISEYLPVELMVPAVGQGALALQTRTDDTRLRAALAALNDAATEPAVTAERTVLAALGGGCSIPLGVLATVGPQGLTLRAALCSPDGRQTLRDTLHGTGEPEALGQALAERLRTRAREVGIVLTGSKP